MKRLLLTLLLGTTISFSSNAQRVEPCGTYQALENLHKQHPDLKAEYDARMLLNNSQVVTTNAKGEKAVSYQVPVVFHILHEYGSENVTDANVYAVMNRLNEDYNATNADTANVIAEFKPIIGDSKIEFKLAAIDPLGNCTNGIEHIYSHETKMGDSYSKLNQWNRSKYMNIWVVNTPNSGGTVSGVLLGYATFPTGTDGSAYWTDGIVLRDWTVSGSDRTLTHEAGHYLSLAHTFGNTEAGDGICGDDGIADTPPTDGSFSTCPLTKDACNPGTVENVQNYMDYSSCIFMFTNDQVTAMHNTLEGIAGQRNILWNDTTLTETGIKNLVLPQTPSNILSVPLCAPVADFSSDKKMVCINQPITFKDASWNATIDNWSWSFEGGTPATSTSMNPSVSFATPGYKTITLTVSNAAGSGTETRSAYVYISPEWADYSGPNQLTLEDGKANWFVVNNPEENHGKFALSNGTGYNQSRSYKLNTFKNVQFADYATDNYFYNDRLEGSIDELITPSFDLRYTSGITVSFKYAYASNATQADQITEILKVSSTRNCGDTWSIRTVTVNGVSQIGGIDGTDLVTAGFAGNADFAPSSNNEWRTGTFTYTPTSADSHTRFKFEFSASDVASNLYIDEIFVDGTLGLISEEISGLDLTVYPNPTVNGEALKVSYFANDNAVTFTLRDTQGKVISNETLTTTNSEINHTLKNTENLPAACYFLEVKSGDFTATKKVVVL